jgi:hypothetical protein
LDDGVTLLRLREQTRLRVHLQIVTRHLHGDVSIELVPTSVTSH